jgi:hypothetical protein
VNATQCGVGLPQISSCCLGFHGNWLVRGRFSALRSSIRRLLPKLYDLKVEVTGDTYVLGVVSPVTVTLCPVALQVAVLRAALIVL